MIKPLNNWFKLVDGTGQSLGLLAVPDNVARHIYANGCARQTYLPKLPAMYDLAQMNSAPTQYYDISITTYGPYDAVMLTGMPLESIHNVPGFAFMPSLQRLAAAPAEPVRTEVPAGKFLSAAREVAG